MTKIRSMDDENKTKQTKRNEMKTYTKYLYGRWDFHEISDTFPSMPRHPCCSVYVYLWCGTEIVNCKE